MVNRLFLDDSYMMACDARVTACAKTENGFLVELDKTVFYPTGGGQPHDTGNIGVVAVTDVSEKDGRILHHTATPLEIGIDVPITINWARRFDHMQQHSGEHLLSFAAKELFQTINVGFHMAASYCTVDFDMPMTPEQLAALEIRTNALICAELPVYLTYVDAEKLESLTLRKAAKNLSGAVRIVYMPGGDSCTCCGTHVKRSGEIGSLKITAAEHYKGGERIAFVCGARALYHAQRMQGIVDALARAFSCNADGVTDAVAKTQQELSAAKRDTKALYTRLNAYLTKELLLEAAHVGKTRILARLVDMPAARLRPLALSLCEKEPVLALLCAREEDMLHYVLCCAKGFPVDVGELVAPVNAALNGKGGGRGTLAQGSAKYAPGLQETLAQLEHYFISRLGGKK